MNMMTTNILKAGYSIKVILFSGACILSSAALAGGSSDISKADMAKIEKEAEDFVEVVDNYTVKQKRKTMKEIDQAVLKLDNNIDNLERKIDKGWDEMSEESREESRQALKELREQRVEMAEWYGSMKSSSDKAWDEMRDGFTEAYEELHEAWVDSERALTS